MTRVASAPGAPTCRGFGYLTAKRTNFGTIRRLLLSEEYTPALFAHVSTRSLMCGADCALLCDCLAEQEHYGDTEKADGGDVLKIVDIGA